MYAYQTDNIKPPPLVIFQPNFWKRVFIFSKSGQMFESGFWYFQNPGRPKVHFLPIWNLKNNRFLVVFPCKTPKKAQFFSRASRAFFQGFHIFKISPPNVWKRVFIFSKSGQMFWIRVLPRGGGLILSPWYWGTQMGYRGTEIGVLGVWS